MVARQMEPIYRHKSHRPDSLSVTSNLLLRHIVHSKFPLSNIVILEWVAAALLATVIDKSLKERLCLSGRDLLVRVLRKRTESRNNARITAAGDVLAWIV